MLAYIFKCFIAIDRGHYGVPSVYMLKGLIKKSLSNVYIIEISFHVCFKSLSNYISSSEIYITLTCHVQILHKYFCWFEYVLYHVESLNTSYWLCEVCSNGRDTERHGAASFDLERISANLYSRSVSRHRKQLVNSQIASGEFTKIFEVAKATKARSHHWIMFEDVCCLRSSFAFIIGVE